MFIVWRNGFSTHRPNVTGKRSEARKMQIIEMLKKVNRTLLEMYLGLFFWAIVCQIVGAVFTDNQLYYAKSLWFGILFAVISILHMYRSLDRALDFGEKDANKMILRGYLIRYVLFILILFIIMYTEVMNPLIVFLAYMGIKVTALIQPITHKLCNKMFHETDPVPEPIPEDVSAPKGDSKEK